MRNIELLQTVQDGLPSDHSPRTLQIFVYRRVGEGYAPLRMYSGSEVPAIGDAVFIDGAKYTVTQRVWDLGSMGTDVEIAQVQVLVEG